MPRTRDELLEMAGRPWRNKEGAGFFGDVQRLRDSGDVAGAKAVLRALKKDFHGTESEADRLERNARADKVLSKRLAGMDPEAAEKFLAKRREREERGQRREASREARDVSTGDTEEEWQPAATASYSGQGFAGKRRGSMRK